MILNSCKLIVFIFCYTFCIWLVFFGSFFFGIILFFFFTFVFGFISLKINILSFFTTVFLIFWGGSLVFPYIDTMVFLASRQKNTFLVFKSNKWSLYKLRECCFALSLPRYDFILIEKSENLNLAPDVSREVLNHTYCPGSNIFKVNSTFRKTKHIHVSCLPLSNEER